MGGGGGGGGGICMRVFTGVGGMKVWVIDKMSISLGCVCVWGGGGGYMYYGIHRVG